MSRDDYAYGMFAFLSRFLKYFLKEESERFGSHIGSLFHTEVAFDENEDIVELRWHFTIYFNWVKDTLGMGTCPSNWSAAFTNG